MEHLVLEVGEAKLDHLNQIMVMAVLRLLVMEPTVLIVKKMHLGMQMVVEELEKLDMLVVLRQQVSS